MVEALVYENPLPGIEPRRVSAVIGSPVRDIVAQCKAPMVCIIDGVPMSRDYWMQREVCAGDRIEFHPVFLGGGGGSRSILGAIAMIALGAFLPGFVAGLSPTLFGTATALTNLGRLVVAGLMMVGNALISAILPAQSSSSNAQGDKASSIYDVDTQGNQAKIFNPIPVQYGYMKAFPDYAAQPYVRYDTRTNKDGDQYYYALFCLGQGEFDIHSITIADAPLQSFQDVQVQRILQPGELPQSVNPCIVTSEAVSGQSLDSGEYVGGFPVCGPGRKARRISFDIVFPQGLSNINDKGKAKGNSVTIVADISPLNDDGFQQSEWETVFQETVNASSLTPQRRTFDIDVEPGRYTIRVRRIGARNKEDNRDMSSAQWSSLRAELIDEATLCKTATHFELVMKASEQLSSLSQRKIAIHCTRKVKDFEGNLIASRSPILALLDKWTNADYGDGLPIKRVDMETLRHYYEVAQAREDFCDYRFESRATSEEADQLIAKTFRSVVLQRQGVKTVVRDELAELPITLFNPTNTTEGTVSLDYVQVTEETGDGVIAEYFSSKTWQWEDVECPAPGRTYTSATHPGYDPALPPMDNPVRLRLEGITGEKHATREGMYYAATNALRRQFVSWQTELQGALVHYGAPVIFTSTLYNSQSGGEVVDYRDEDGSLRLSGNVNAGDSLIFMNADGTLTEPMKFTSLGDGWIKVDFTGAVNFGDYAKERTRYAAVSGELIRRIVKITSLEPRGMGNTGAPEYALKGVVDVPEVHTVDIPWLPTGNEENDEPTGESGATLGNGVLRVQTRLAQFPDSGYPASLLFTSGGELFAKYYMEGKIQVPYEGLRAWATAPQENVGTLFEIAIALNPPSLPAQELSKYLWTGATQPGNNMILPGHKMRRVETGEDDATRQLINKARNASGATPYISEWRTLARDVEYSGFWDGFAPYVENGELVDVTLTRVTGFIAIRDKATKTLQAIAPYEFGYFTK